MNNETAMLVHEIKKVMRKLDELESRIRNIEGTVDTIRRAQKRSSI